MNREVHVRFWEGLAVRFRWATQLVFSNSSSLRIRIAPHVPTYLSILAGHIEFTNAEGWISLAIHLQKSMSSPLGVRRHEIFIGESVSNASAPLPLAEEAHETVH